MVCLCRRSKKLSGTNAQQVQGVAPAITGQWGNPTGGNVSAIVVEMPNGTLSGTWVNTNRPAFSGTRTGNALSVNFPDDRTYAGTVSLDGYTIQWDTAGNTWSRWEPSLTGNWAGNQVAITENANGTLSGKWLTNSRPNFSGTRTLNTLSMSFPDDRTYNGTIQNGGGRIQWDTATNFWLRSINGPVITGRWYNPNTSLHTIAVITEVNGTITGMFTNGRPNFSGSRTGDSLSVNFPDDRTYAGTVWFDGVRIQWDTAANYWIRVPTITGNWAGNAVNIQEGLCDGQINGKWLTNGRPNFTGTQVNNTITVNFPDDRTYTGLVSGNASFIQWDTVGNTWTRSGW
jgi:hypothetical protein